MMQDGLHIGLAAWINEQRNIGGFAVYPPSPIATELVDLEAVKGVTDLTRAAEFALLVNFVARQGQVADTFSSISPLWEVHRNILGRMDFATEPWTNAEKAQYQAARDTLYTTDASGQLEPSQELHLYEEMKSAYQDLQKSGGTQTEIAQALANWMVLGYKQSVENALETIVRLSSRSSRNQAESESALLEPSRLPIRGDGLPFAATYFAPISAIARETWMEAKVSFEDLDSAVDNSPAGTKWKAYFANRNGEVSFNYSAVSCLRPWYTPALYQADDWKLSTEGTLVSKGNGSEGLLPAYVDAVYLVSVKDVTVRALPPPPPPELSRSPRPRLGGILTTELAEARLAQPKSLDSAGPPAKGIVAKPLNTAGGLIPAQPSGTVLTSTATAGRFLALNSGAVRRLTAVDLAQRFMVAQEFLEGKIQPAVPAPEAPKIYVAGFGCVKVPLAPNPNVNYSWS
jgi:hypothetical protein